LSFFTRAGFVGPGIKKVKMEEFSRNHPLATTGEFLAAGRRTVTIKR